MERKAYLVLKWLPRFRPQSRRPAWPGASSMQTTTFSVPHPIDDTVITGTFEAFEVADLPNLDEASLTKAASDAMNKRILKARVNAALKDLRAQMKTIREKTREEFQPKEYTLDESRGKLGERFNESVLEHANKRALRAAKKSAKEAALPESLRAQIRAAKTLAKSAGLDAKVILSQIQKMISEAKK